MHKFKLSCLPLLLLLTNIIAQNVPDRISYPDTLWTNNDTFFVKGKLWEKEWALTTNTSDTVDLGTDGFEGMYVKVWTQDDTITIPYVNAPFEQWLFIPIASMKDTTIYRLRFNSQGSKFSDEYASNYRGNASFQIPEVYELANIILYLSDCSVLTGNHSENSEYAKLVLNQFGPFRSHPLIQILNKTCSNGNHWSTYYGFRENSMCFKFDENSLLQYSTSYKHVYNDNSDILGGEFRNLLYLVQDFANQTDFRSFYKNNNKYYRKLESRQKKLQPIRKMWKWLEADFPQRYNSYKVIFSPLIEGSHSTQNFFKGSYQKPEFKECLMFINSPENIDFKSEYSERIKEGIMSGIVFTEIDHNYVNPASADNIKAIRDLIKNKDLWATKNAQENYRTEYAIFNEYMTHSLFCLYVKENYKEKEGSEIVNQRIKLMERRGFFKFDQFNEKLIHLLKGRKKTISEMYPAAIEIMKEIK